MTCARAIALLAVVATGCDDAPSAARDDALSVSVEQASAWIRNFNPLLPSGVSRWPSRAGIYEPLAIYNGVTSEWTPWLATSWTWSEDLRTVRFSLRSGVRWSDGAPFTARDVAFTFALLREHRALDISGVWSFLSGVRAIDELTVEMTLAHPYAPGFGDLAHQPIVAAHLWQGVDDPVAFANPDPVGTGPFTELRLFRNQVYELGRNPHYWQPGVPAVEALRLEAYPSNEQAHLAMIEGSIDWAGNFVPVVERTYVERDPAHYHYWFPTIGPTIMLYPNAARPPLDEPGVRKALSMAIDRDRLAAIAMEGYTHPADGSGLSDGYASWKDPEAAAAGWVRFDRAAAERLLDDAGFTREGEAIRRGADGRPLALELQVVSGWSDWVRAAQLIARDLRAVGIDASVRIYEFGAWFANVQRGEFELAVGWTLDGPTPYRFYRFMMASDTVEPLGVAAGGNWHRVGDGQADILLAQLERTADRERQHAIGVELQRRFAEVAPAVPLFPSPLWGTYSTRRFVGFPHADDPYAKLAPHAEPDSLLVLTRLRPRAGAGEDD